MKQTHARPLAWALALALALSLLPAPALAAFDPDALEARDTDFFTPVYHTDLNYDEIEYEHIDPAPLLAEIEALRALSAGAENAEAFKTRFLALADELERMIAMDYILENRKSADSKDAWAEQEYAKVDEELMTVSDAFSALVRDALGSPCASALEGMMSESVRRDFLEYEDMTDEELALRTRDTALQSEYMSRIVDEYAVTWEGKTYTRDSVAEAYDNDEIDYDTYWNVYVELAKTTNAAVGGIFLEMIGVRNQIAQLKGYDTYAAYAYENIYGRDYTPEDAAAFCEAVKKYIAPKYRAYGLIAEYPDARELPEDVVYSGEGMFETLLPYFAQLSDELLESALYTYEHKAYDVDPAPNKTGTAYSGLIPYYQIPFYFNNATGTWYDLAATIHELGHNNNAYWKPENWNDPSLVFDTAEVHSQALELLMTRFYPELFGTQADRAMGYITYNMLYIIVTGCLYDELQRWAYETPGVTLAQVNQKYRQLCGEYGIVDEDDERTELYGWYEVPHNFTGPMYYISYATSAAGAFAFWEAAQDDYFAAVDDYLRFTAQSNELGFEDTFLAVGMESPFTEAYLRNLADTVHDELLPVRPYADVYADDWFADSVIFVDYYELMNGVASDAFAPEAAATREQSMTILARISDEREDAEAPYTLDEGVAWAMENGVSDGADRSAELTREQFVTMIYRCAELWDVDVSVGEDTNILSYNDSFDVSEWAIPAMQWAIGCGLINGMGDGTLAPQGAVTRAQMATIVTRLFTGP